MYFQIPTDYIYLKISLVSLSALLIIKNFLKFMENTNLKYIDCDFWFTYATTRQWNKTCWATAASVSSQGTMQLVAASLLGSIQLHLVQGHRSARETISKMTFMHACICLFYTTNLNQFQHKEMRRSVCKCVCCVHKQSCLFNELKTIVSILYV